MKLNKEKFLKTEFGREMTRCVDCWDYDILDNNYDGVIFWQAQWEVYQIAMKQFYGIEYHFTRTDDYYGIVTEDESDWLYKVERDINNYI